MLEVVEKKDCIVFTVLAIPRSAQSLIIGEHDGALKLKLNSAPVDGVANRELIKLLAKVLGVAKGAISIVGGANSRRKKIRVDGISKASLLEFADTLNTKR